MRKTISAPVILDNDMDFASMGKMHSGLAVGVESFVLIQLGTGVGAWHVGQV